MNMAQPLSGNSRSVTSNGPDFASVYQKRDTSSMQTPATDSMPSFNRLLVATDFSPASQAAFRTALDNCSALGASLVILHVFEYAEPAPPETGGLLIELQALREKCSDTLRRVAPAGRAGRRALRDDPGDGHRSVARSSTSSRPRTSISPFWEPTRCTDLSAWSLVPPRKRFCARPPARY